ncbi:hypothetical protein K491DRAFT_683088 [Lophiostoma macrostomum CBS 122681]|uniref:Uncharacterized protein n=1 Tax=Lophiostoma macrostomum CBS 122681 TaxID=1314788 RepID=A0A6A6STI5_9PLEO|nr:hypothetical protein K491DRAFT_683088 [Lophiostoma macrostomum CBS 122681]
MPRSYTLGSPTVDKKQDDSYDGRFQWPILVDNKIALVNRNLHDFLQAKEPKYDEWRDAVVGGNALHYAAHRGQTATVTDLLILGADVNNCDMADRTPCISFWPTTREAFVGFMRFCAQKRLLFERTAAQNESNLLKWREHWARLREVKDGHVLPQIADIEAELEDAEHRATVGRMSIRDVSYDQRAYLVPLRHYTETRVVFRAESGNLVIAPADTCVGDSICTIGGAHMRFVIRESQEDLGTWKLVGEACMPYVLKSAQVVDLFFQ